MYTTFSKLVCVLMLVNATQALLREYPEKKHKYYMVTYKQYPENDIEREPEANSGSYAVPNADIREKSNDVENDYARWQIRRDIDAIDQQPVQFTTFVMQDARSAGDENDAEYSKLCMKPNEQIIGKTFEDHRNKSRYIVCLDYGTAAIMECPKTTLYNPFRSMCVPRDEVDEEECDGFTRSEVCSCKYGTNKNNECRREPPCESERPCGQHKCYNVPSVPNGYLCECENNLYDDCCCHGFVNQCPIGKTHFYKEKGRHFVHCAKDGSAYVKECPQGMVFDESKITCVSERRYDLDKMRRLQQEV